MFSYDNLISMIAYLNKEFYLKMDVYDTYKIYKRITDEKTKADDKGGGSKPPTH